MHTVLRQGVTAKEDPRSPSHRMEDTVASTLDQRVQASFGDEEQYCPMLYLKGKSKVLKCRDKVNCRNLKQQKVVFQLINCDSLIFRFLSVKMNGFDER